MNIRKKYFEDFGINIISAFPELAPKGCSGEYVITSAHELFYTGKSDAQWWNYKSSFDFLLNYYALFSSENRSDSFLHGGFQHLFNHFYLCMGSELTNMEWDLLIHFYKNDLTNLVTQCGSSYLNLGLLLTVYGKIDFSTEFLYKHHLPFVRLPRSINKILTNRELIDVLLWTQPW